MSGQGKELPSINYYAERMLGALYDGDEKAQTQLLYDLATAAAARNNLEIVPVYLRLVGLWNGETYDLRRKDVSGEEARETVYRFIGEMFAKYGIPDPGYEAENFYFGTGVEPVDPEDGGDEP